MVYPFVVFNKANPREGVELHLTFSQTRILKHLLDEVVDGALLDEGNLTKRESTCFKALQETLEGL